MNSFTRIFSSILLLLLFIFCAQNILPQENVNKKASGKISGRVFDKLTGKPLQFASFVVKSVRDSTRSFSSETDSSGNFSITNIPSGVYRAQVNLLGYQPRSRKNIMISVAKNELKIDTLYLMPLGITKEEVQVMAQRERIVYDKDNNDKITINPDRDWGVNALELLENTPMVHVDFDEKNITLMGKLAPQIFVNGMPGIYSGIESAEDLKILSADDIDKIELIINPTAEYGNYSGGGVINFVLKKRMKESFSSNSTFYGNSDNNYNSNISAKYNTPSASASLTYINGYSYHTANNSLMRQITFNNITDFMNQSAETDTRNIANRISLMSGLQLPNDYIFRNVSRYNEGYNTTDKNYQNDFSGNNYNNNALSKNLLKLFSTAFTAMKTLSGTGHFLNSSFSYSNNRMNIENNYNQRQLLSFQTLADTSIAGNDISDNTNEFTNWGLTYNNMFNEYFKLTASYWGNYRGMNMKSDYYRFSRLVSRNVELDNKKINQHSSDYNHMISTSISGKIIEIMYNLRLNTNLKRSIVNSAIGNYSFRYNLTSFDPMINISTNIADGHSIGLGYSSFTNFPQNYQLNPFTDYSDTTNIITGNPELKAGTSRMYSFNYLFRTNYTAFSISGDYDFNKDIVSSVISPVAQGITKTTFANFANMQNYNVRMFCSTKLFNLLDLNQSFSAGKSKYSGIGVQTEGTSWGSSLYAMLSFSTLKFEADIYYSSASVYVQDKTKPTWSMDASAKLLLLNKTLSLTLRASDIFNTRNSNSSQNGTGLFITNNIKQTTRIISLSLSYFFKLEAQDTIEPEIHYDVLPSEF
jgi:hypothetical protein